MADRIDVLKKNECFISYKDHKDGFPGRIDTRLINPSKTNIGKISKVILQRINSNLRIKTGLNQWQSSDQAISWFNNIMKLVMQFNNSIQGLIFKKDKRKLNDS